MAILSRARSVVSAAFLALASLGASIALAQPGEYEVKAAFLCSFAEFVAWPDQRDGPVTIGVLGDDPFGPLLEETARSRPLQTTRLEIHRPKSVEEARRYRIVYISASEEARTGDLLASLDDAGVLTVSDIPGFARQGGIIGFVLENRRVRFEINVDAAEQSRLRISSRLLNLARVVGSRPES